MKIIVYKTRSKSYECTEIRDNGGEDIRIIFDEPISGSLTIKKEVFPITRGICKMSVRQLSNGECSPMLFANGRQYKLESFYIKDGILLRSAPDGDYIRELYENYLKLQKRVSEIEARLADMDDKITQKIKF